MDIYHIERSLKTIENLQRLLIGCETNGRYIKLLQALKIALYRFDLLMGREGKLSNEYSSIHQSYFSASKGFSYYDRICLSIQEYEYGVHPFIES